MNDDSKAMASEPLEGFHEVNLASPTTPDLHGLVESHTTKRCAVPRAPYRAPALSSSSRPPNALQAGQLPTQPVYSTPRHLGTEEPHNGSVPGLDLPLSACGSARLGADPAQGVVLGNSEGEEGLGSDGSTPFRSPSLMAVRDRGNERLKEELAKAQREAHRIVREANMKQAMAEKQLKEALGKIDVLQAEVAALKNLVLSNSPTSPCKDPPLGPKAPSKKGHIRNKSTSSAMLAGQQELSIAQPVGRDCKEVDPLLLNEFKAWREDPQLERNCSFLERIYREDIYPCLTFSKSELGSAILDAVERNTLSVEPVGFQQLPVVRASAMECGGPKKCALSGQTKTCKHRIKLGDSSSYYYVSPFCRYRITSVCNFFTYIRYIHQGLVKQQDAEQMFWEVMQLRKEMSFAKLGYYREEP
ncbi:hypothetical protein AGOR_G00179830 [Albula goreensis]|uniref:Rab-3A-interacting protein n=1 Tax=Albula goreensis TaxID=1534307 RepID=A0A8T3CWB6_9TELE|nr:hypothetical protein AGOR_G00179830 [Albula goreensis]